MMYFFLFLFPLCFTLFTGKEGDDAMLLISAIPAIILFAIELIHLRNKGPLIYFKGGGYVDFFNFFAFCGLVIIKFSGNEGTVIFMPELKLMLMTTSFIKLLFFEQMTVGI